MQAHPLDHILAGIDTLDLEPIKFKLTSEKDEYRWSREHADRIEVAYRRFLVLMAKYPERAIAPTRDIDTFWHAHILDTRKYAADCQRVFGEFVHHHPYIGLHDDEADRQAHAAAGAAMNELYAAEFGEPLPADGAYCVREPQAAANGTAYCVRSSQPGAGSAYCVRQPQQDAGSAYCVRQPERTDGAAYCVRQPQQETSAAYCVRRPEQETRTAYCVRQPVVA